MSRLRELLVARAPLEPEQDDTAPQASSLQD
jgi:hypothetical protein